uniref:Secreted protein n=1 Tax=Rhipicephalus zambeziensis TaxID=60191 RepID=A0A224YLF8_9ACAR
MFISHCKIQCMHCFFFVFLLSMFFAQWCTHTFAGAHTVLCQASRARPPLSFSFLLSAKRRKKKDGGRLRTLQNTVQGTFLFAFFTSHNDPRRFTITHKLNNNAVTIAVQTPLG